MCVCVLIYIYKILSDYHNQLVNLSITTHIVLCMCVKLRLTINYRANATHDCSRIYPHLTINSYL